MRIIVRGDKKLNQILDRTSSKKNNNGARRNPKDTPKIVKVYAALMIIFALCLIGTGGYTYYDNNMKNVPQQEVSKIPTIELVAKDDKVTINVTAPRAIEEINYQWYTGDRTVEDIHNFNNEVDKETSSEPEEISDDEDVEIKEQEMTALGSMIQKKGNGNTDFSIPNVGIPRGTNTLHITVRLQAEGVLTEFVKTYTTDVGVDQIPPTMKIYMNKKSSNPKIVVIATDETEIKNVIYSIQTDGGTSENDVSVSERVDNKTIRAEIPLKPNEVNEITVTAVDKASNTATPYKYSYDLFLGKPEIVELTAEPDFSKVYALIRYQKGIKKAEYQINDEEPVVKEFDGELPREIVMDIPTVVGHNHIIIKAYAEEESVYVEDYGDCDYNP